MELLVNPTLEFLSGEGTINILCMDRVFWGISTKTISYRRYPRGKWGDKDYDDEKIVYNFFSPGIISSTVIFDVAGKVSVRSCWPSWGWIITPSLHQPLPSSSVIGRVQQHCSMIMMIHWSGWRSSCLSCIRMNPKARRSRDTFLYRWWVSIISLVFPISWLISSHRVIQYALYWHNFNQDLSKMLFSVAIPLILNCL